MAQNGDFATGYVYPCIGAGISAALFLFIAFFASSSAWAIEVTPDPIPDEIQEAVERTAAEYKDAKKKADDATAALRENRDKIDELEKEIPAQQERSDKAARELYKTRHKTGDIVDILLNSTDFSDFVNSFEYASRVSEANLDEINRLSEMKEELDERQTALKEAKVEADENAEKASEALEAAKEARQEAQRRAQEDARKRAAKAEEVERAKERTMAEATVDAAHFDEAASSANNADSDSGELAETDGDEPSADAEGKSGASDSADASDPDASDDAVADADAAADADDSDSSKEETPVQEPITASLDDDGADWTLSEEDFVKEWGERIDAYLAGSALEGQGKTFASAAWEYGVDPRWSPAISCTESSKGGVCFKPHNAWGWGSESWDSWEEAIDAHVRGLARGYGYTITVGAAQTYCPPNWGYWYNNTVNEMNSI